MTPVFGTARKAWSVGSSLLLMAGRTLAALLISANDLGTVVGARGLHGRGRGFRGVRLERPEERVHGLRRRAPGGGAVGRRFGGAAAGRFGAGERRREPAGLRVHRAAVRELRGPAER